MLAVMHRTHSAVVRPLKMVVDHGRKLGASPAVVELRSNARPVKRADRSERTRVRGELEHIVASEDFDASRRSRDFLRFIVEEALAGRGGALTQAGIAIGVFGRRDDFDAVVDPIVRIQAGRLRRSLERYYLLSGAVDPLRIELPRGTYVPVFRPLAERERGSVDRPYAPAPLAGPAADWPRVALGRFEPATGAEQESATRLMETLLLELGRYPDVQVSLQSDLAPGMASRNDCPRFSLRGRMREEDGDVRVTARLVDHTSGAQVWGDEYYGKAGPGRWSGSLDDIGRVIAARVGGEEGVVMQLLAAEHRTRRLGPLTPHCAIMLSHRFSLTHDPEGLAAALHALRQVVAEEPGCGPAWSRLAGLCLTNHALEITKPESSLDEALDHAQRGLSLDPANRRARCVLAAALLVKGELGAARHELDAALRLTPDSLVYLEVIGHLLSLLGDKRGPALVRRARERNPHCLPHASFGLWFDHLRRGELEAAYEEALAYRDPAFFWRAVMRATCLAHLGRIREAESEVAEILRERQDFAARGRVLIGRFIKFPEVTGQIIGGLAKAGLKLA